MHSTTRRATMIAAALFIGACARKDASNYDSANGAVNDSTPPDTTMVVAGTTPPTVGPLIDVTKTDGKSVMDATQLEITDQNFAHFQAAAESLSVLAGRDTSVGRIAREYLAGAGSTDVDAGLKLLESNPAIVNALSRAGISARDYFVMGIALGDAERDVATQTAAPPTRVGAANIAFVKNHQAAIARLRDISTSPSVIVTPSSGKSASSSGYNGSSGNVA